MQMRQCLQHVMQASLQMCVKQLQYKQHCQRCMVTLVKLAVIRCQLPSLREIGLQSLASSGQNRSHVPRLFTFTQVKKAVFVASFRQSFNYNRQRKTFQQETGWSCK